MHAGPWIAAYIIAVLLWWAVLAMGTAPTLWRGNALLFFNAVFIAVSIVVMAAKQAIPSGGLVVFDLLLIALVLLMRDVWLLLHVDRARAAEILEECFAKTRTKYARSDVGYVLTVAEAQIRITLAPLGETIRLTFTGGPGSKKAELVRALIVKQFRGSFPA